MGKYRKRFNEKARSGMVAKQTALKRARQKQFHRDEDGGNNDAADVLQPVPTDSNAEELLPVTEQERLERKRALQEQLYSENTVDNKVSRSKRKRLDKYIDHQLKREHKKILLEKLSKTRVNTAALAPSKLLGTGRQTRREEMQEALELERNGRADEHTRNILYEERVVKEWSDDDLDRADNDIQDSRYYSEEEEEALPDIPVPESDEDHSNLSSFVDNRPAKFGGAGSGFGFAGLASSTKEKTSKKYSWRKRLHMEERKRNKIEEENDFVSSGDDNNDDDGDDEEMPTESEQEFATDSEKDERQVSPGTKSGASSRSGSGSNSDSESDSDSKSEPDTGDNDEEDHNEEGKSSSAQVQPKKSSQQPKKNVSTSSMEALDDESSENDSDNSGDEDDLEDLNDENLLDEEDVRERAPRFPKSHSSASESFKQWAEQQVKELEGRTSEAVLPTLSKALREQLSVPTHHEEDFDRSSDEEGYVRIDKTLERAAFAVEVERNEIVAAQRLGLPVFGEEHRIMEAINHHDCVVICGETGSGKTTQVPQFLYENGFGNHQSPLHRGMIGITQPRRVAAVSMAQRVGTELGNHGHRVGHQIRFDTTIKDEGTENGTAMKFMTDGVLLREMMTDFMLHKYSAIVIDEAHERNINTDILIGMLSRILKLRRTYHQKNPQKYCPLKLIIMSATLRVSDFSENTQLFATPPPIISVAARQYPVSVHFNKRTQFDYVEEAFKKTCKIHRRLPPGGILIFLTGQQEIVTMVKKLTAEFPLNQATLSSTHETITRRSNNTEPEAEDVDFGVRTFDNGDINDDYESEDEEEEGFEEQEGIDPNETSPLYVLPLYSLLPTKEQMKVFEAPPPGARICVVATNVAETSLTIPGIRYVVDCGRAKERKYNEENGVQLFEIDWVSKAAADQRTGRAGRTGPGHCYRLYSSAIYESEFDQFSRPEILRMPIESIVLNMKSMGIDTVSNFPFPTPPDRHSLVKSEKLLRVLGALNPDTNKVTDLGKLMALFPVSPRFAKMLIIGNQRKCLGYIIAIVAAMSAGDPFLSEAEVGIMQVRDEEGNVTNDTEATRKLRSQYSRSRALFSQLDPTSDVLMLLLAVCAFDHVPRNHQASFAAENFLRLKTMEEIAKLRAQLGRIVAANTAPDLIGHVETDHLLLNVPDKLQVQAIKQMVALGFLDQVAVRGDMVSQSVVIANKMNVIAIPYAPVLPIHGHDIEADPYVYIHPNSVLSQCGSAANRYIVYLSLNTGSNTKEGQLPKVRMRPMVVLLGKQLANIGKQSPMLTYSKPLGHPYAPKYINSNRRECYVVPRFGAAIGSGGVGWDLPAIKVIQVRSEGVWRIES